VVIETRIRAESGSGRWAGHPIIYRRARVRRGAAALDDGEQRIMDEYQKLKQLVDEVADDVYKAVGGNKAAGTRVRKIMQDIKNTAQEVRKKILDLRVDEEQPQAPSQPQP
jgi:hypothetical protein